MTIPYGKGPVSTRALLKPTMSSTLISLRGNASVGGSYRVISRFPFLFVCCCCAWSAGGLGDEVTVSSASSSSLPMGSNTADGGAVRDLILHNNNEIELGSKTVECGTIRKQEKCQWPAVITV